MSKILLEVFRVCVLVHLCAVTWHAERHRDHHNHILHSAILFNDMQHIVEKDE